VRRRGDMTGTPSCAAGLRRAETRVDEGVVACGPPLVVPRARDHAGGDAVVSTRCRVSRISRLGGILRAGESLSGGERANAKEDEERALDLPTLAAEKMQAVDVSPYDYYLWQLVASMTPQSAVSRAAFLATLLPPDSDSSGEPCPSPSAVAAGDGSSDTVAGA